MIDELTTLLSCQFITVAAIFAIVNPLTTAFVFMSLLPHAISMILAVTALQFVINGISVVRLGRRATAG